MLVIEVDTLEELELLLLEDLLDELEDLLLEELDDDEEDDDYEEFLYTASKVVSSIILSSL